MNAIPKAPSTADLVIKHKDQIALALPSHIDANRMARVARTELTKNPTLARCDPYSFMGALIQACQLGLEPGSGLGHAYLIPFKNQVQLIIGYQGMIELAMRSGKIDSIYADLAYDTDTFDYFVEDGAQRLNHRPNLRGTRHPNDIIAVYAIAKIKGGGNIIEVMTPEEVAEVEKASRKGQAMSNVWQKFWGEMAKKTCIRRLYKKLPKSVEMVNVHAFTATEHEAPSMRRVVQDVIPELHLPEETEPGQKSLDKVFEDEQSAE